MCNICANAPILIDVSKYVVWAESKGDKAVCTHESLSILSCLIIPSSGCPEPLCSCSRGLRPLVDDGEKTSSVPGPDLVPEATEAAHYHMSSPGGYTIRCHLSPSWPRLLWRLMMRSGESGGSGGGGTGVIDGCRGQRCGASWDEIGDRGYIIVVH